MDQYLAWNNLNLMQQLNCVCDTLAKRAITTAIISGYLDRPTQLLPREDVALAIWGNKVTGNISSPLHFRASKELARNYLQTQSRDRWTNENFDEVDWEHLDLALKTSPTCTKSGSQNKHPDSVEPASRSECTRERWHQMKDAQTADNAKQLHTLCYAQTKIGQDLS
jgi:hypothetical protein